MVARGRGLSELPQSNAEGQRRDRLPQARLPGVTGTNASEFKFVNFGIRVPYGKATFITQYRFKPTRDTPVALPGLTLHPGGGVKVSLEPR